MLYKMLQTRILDSRYKIGANLQTELSKNDENDEKFNFFDIHRNNQESFQNRKTYSKTISD